MSKRLELKYTITVAGVLEYQITATTEENTLHFAEIYGDRSLEFLELPFERKPTTDVRGLVQQEALMRIQEHFPDVEEQHIDIIPTVIA